jgi:type IV secretory pathway VirB2 component (pilin)
MRLRVQSEVNQMTIAVALLVVATMAVNLALGLLRISNGWRQALRVIVLMVGLYCAVALRHVFA